MQSSRTPAEIGADFNDIAREGRMMYLSPEANLRAAGATQQIGNPHKAEAGNGVKVSRAGRPDDHDGDYGD